MIDYSRFIEERTRDFTGREWVFQAIDDWLDEFDSSPVFLLTGEPGSGKTAIAARLAQLSDGQVASNGLSHLAPGFLSAYYFCSAGDRRWISPHTFAESLALQLSHRYPTYAKALAEKSGEGRIRIDVQQYAQTIEGGGKQIGVVIQHLDAGGVTPEDAFIRVVREPLEVLLQEEKLEQVVILIDALDEALTYSGQVGIVSLIAEAADLPSEVRFILTSRRDERVENEFFEADGFFLSASEFDSRNNADVTRYINTRLGQADLAAQTAALNQEQKADLVSQIGHKAAGNFLYVRFGSDPLGCGQISHIPENDQTACSTGKPSPRPKTGHLKGTNVAFRDAQMRSTLRFIPGYVLLPRPRPPLVARVALERAETRPLSTHGR